MIHEIVQFIEYLENISSEIFSENLDLKKGLYVFLEKENGEFVIKDENILKVEKKIIKEDFNEQDKKLYDSFIDRYYNSLMLSANKSFLGKPGSFIEIGSPFGIRFKKEAVLKDVNKTLNDLKLYFNNAEKYLDNTKAETFKLYKNFKEFCVNQLLSVLETNEILNNYNNKNNIFLFSKEVSLLDFKNAYQNYLKVKVFLESGEKEYGISGDLNVGNVDKKLFMRHKTASFETNCKVDGDTALKLYKFFRLQQKNEVFPNPLPLFVDRDELTKNAISIYKNDRKKGHKEIIEDLINKGENLQNYYLFFFQNNLKGSRIIDLDFVPVFRYKVEDIKLHEPFSVGGKLLNQQINNIFDFQNNVLNKIFNKQLIQETKKGLWIKYFDDIEVKPEYGATDSIVNLFYKYRKAFYDYIYKSKRQAITSTMFHDIMQNSILDDVRHDKEYDKGYRIKEKLNIWFSLYNYFNNKKNNVNMASKIPELLEKCRKVANDDNKHLSDDPKEFAFAAGQIIYFLLGKSEAGNKTHALLEPFLQKTKAEHLQNAISNTIGVYKHAIDFGKGRFERLSKEVLAYETNVNIKDLQRFILAGYFAQPVIYEKSPK